jgi:hypothetical protein
MFMPNESFAMRGRFKTFIPPGGTAGAASIVMPIEILEDSYATAQEWEHPPPQNGPKRIHGVSNWITEVHHLLGFLLRPAPWYSRTSECPVH